GSLQTFYRSLQLQAVTLIVLYSLQLRALLYLERGSLLGRKLTFAAIVRLPTWSTLCSRASHFARGKQMKSSLLSTILLILGLWTATAQVQERGSMPPGDAVVGKVTTVGPDSLVVVPLIGGAPVTVKVSESTRVSKERQPIKLSEIKPDDV